MKKVILICILAAGIITIFGMRAVAATIGDTLATPMPSPAMFVNTSNQWLVNAWQWGSGQLKSLMGIRVTDPAIATIFKIANWFWNFTVTSFRQGWDSFLALFKMAVTSGSAAYNTVHWPWQ